jgi:hypothetical protein
MAEWFHDWRRTRFEVAEETTMRSWAFLLLFSCLATAGCGSSTTGPDGAARLVFFQDPDSSLSTSDVRDAEDQIVRFDSEDETLIWTLTGATFPGWQTSGNFLDASRRFQVRFGTKDGTRRAYFTETAADTICDIQVNNGQLIILPTDVPVP